MRKLYHHPICPLSRQIRIFLKELEMNFSLVKEEYWSRNEKFLLLNPSGEVPVLEEQNGCIIVGVYPIIEYLYEKYPDFILMCRDIITRSENRRLFFWFNNKFYREITKIIIDEKIIRPIAYLLTPRSNLLKAAQHNLVYHFNYLSFLLEKNSFLCGDFLSCADIVSASHISVLDYFGLVNWDKWLFVRNWYSIIKSRPSFRQLLYDHVAGFNPPKYYSELDF